MVEKTEKVEIDPKIKSALEGLRIPKVFGLENRRDYQSDEHTAEMMNISNKDFYDIALKEIELYGQKVLVYPHVNLQARITMGCNSQCGFCIERYSSNRVSELESLAYADRLEESIQTLQEQGIFPSVTITGGEPCIDSSRLEGVLSVLERRGVTKYNVNTNGTFLLREPDIIERFRGKLPYLNISMHHWDPDKSSEIMGGENNLGIDDVAKIVEQFGEIKYGNIPRLRLQCVLLDGYVQDTNSMQEYLVRSNDAGVDDVSFRGLSTLSCGNYGTLTMVGMNRVLDNLAEAVKQQKAKGWEFVCQNIADWYCYEDWKFRTPSQTETWTDVHLNFSNMANLRRYESEEQRRGLRYVREFVVFEDGVFSTGWNKDLGFLKR